VHRSGEANFIFVVHGDTNEQFSFSDCLAKGLSQCIAPFNKVVGVACDGGISHMSELDLATSRQETVQNCWDFTLQHQFTVDQLNFLSRHLRSANTSSLLGASGRRAIVLNLVVLIHIFFV
jgi:hypothetical protein